MFVGFQLMLLCRPYLRVMTISLLTSTKVILSEFDCAYGLGAQDTKNS